MNFGSAKACGEHKLDSLDSGLHDGCVGRLKVREIRTTTVLP